MEKLRILLLSSAHPQEPTYFRAFSFGKYLTKLGHRTSLIVTSGKKSFCVARKSIDGVDVFILPRMHVRGHRVSEPSLLGQSLRIVSRSLTQTLLNCVMADISDFDILHSFDAAAPQNAIPTLMCKILRLLRGHSQKIFVDWDDQWGTGGLLSKTVYSRQKLLCRSVDFLEKRMLLSADAVTVLNETLGKRALYMGVKPEKMFVLPSGANVDLIKPFNVFDAREKLGLPPKKIIYAVIGHLEDESFKLLMRAHKKVVKHHPDSTLLLVRPLRHHADFVKSSEMIRNVILVEGWQPYEKLILYYAASNVLLLPMHDNLWTRTRTPLRLYDYLSAGRPIVSTCLPEIAKLIQACGLLAIPGDPDDFAERVLTLIENPDLRKEMGRRGRELVVDRYSWQICTRRLEKVYSRFL